MKIWKSSRAIGRFAEAKNQGWNSISLHEFLSSKFYSFAPLTPLRDILKFTQSIFVCSLAALLLWLILTLRND